MNEQQYCHLCENRRARGPASLGELSPREKRQSKRWGRVGMPPVRAIVAKAAKDGRQRAAAARGWKRIADPEWLRETTVVGMQGDKVTVAVSSEALCFALRRQSKKLERLLGRLVVGASRVSFVVAERSRDDLWPADGGRSEK